jgi:hypothetical protein
MEGDQEMLWDGYLDELYSVHKRLRKELDSLIWEKIKNRGRCTTIFGYMGIEKCNEMIGTMLLRGGQNFGVENIPRLVYLSGCH